LKSIFWSLLMVVFFLALHPACAQDTTPPNLVSFEFSPNAINTATSSQDITFTAHLTDDLSGIGPIAGDGERWSGAQFRSPSGNQHVSVSLFSQYRVSGTDLDGIYVSKAILPRYSEQGTWTLEYLALYDRVGNRRELSWADMIALGFPADFQVVSTDDTVPPNIISFDFNPKAINTAASSQDITFTAHLTDDLSGIGPIAGDGERWSGAQFRSPSGSQHVSVSLFSQYRVSGTDLDGIYVSKATLPRYSEQGTWTLEYLALYDRVGNRRELSRADMIVLGFPVDFQVVSTDDTAPPSIVSFDFNPKAINTAASSQDITFTAHLTDDLSGIGPIAGDGERWSGAQFRSPSGNQHVSVSLFSQYRVSGTDLDGIYVSKATLPRYSEQGTWTLEYLTLYDRVGNRREQSQADLISLGFPTEFRNSPISGGLSISGMKFNDLNSNGIKDAGESGVPDWAIELLQGGNTIEATATGSDGSYSFNYLGAGTYTLREVPQAGWTQTYPTGNVHTVALSDRSSTDNDFGNHQLVNSDITPPNVASFNFNPKTIDTTSSSQQISFTVHLTDDLSGLGCREINENSFMCGGGQAYFRSPSGQQNVWVSFSPQDLVSGNDLNGVYASKLTMPKYSEQGTWTLEYFSIQDRVGNRRELSRGEMASHGFPTDFRVESQGDTSPPNLISFDFDPKTINTAASSQQISFTAHITDDLSGLGCREINDNSFICGGGQAYFRSPSGQQNVHWSSVKPTTQL